MADSTDALTSPTVTITKGTKREAELDDVSPSKIKALKASARNGRNGETLVGDDALKHKNGDDHDEDDDDDDDDDDDVNAKVVGEGGDYDEEDGSDDDYDDDDDVENGEEDEGDSKASAGKSNCRRVAAAGASVDSGANDSGDGEEDDEEDDEQE